MTLQASGGGGDDTNVAVIKIPPSMTSNEDKVLHVLATQKATTRALADTIGIKTSSVSVACRRLQARGRVRGSQVGRSRDKCVEWEKIDS